MDEHFWRSRWSEGKIGFHEGRPNAFLEAHAAELGAGGNVLVPLCGKTVDLEFLASRGQRVVGIELVEDAVRAFFSERALTPLVEPRGALTAYSSGAVTVLAGDFFATTSALVGPVTALYDRAALIALPAELRRRYVQHLRALLPAGAPGLVVTVEYPQAELEGPPFSVVETELREHYAGCEVRLLNEARADSGRLAALGERVRERCFRVTF